MFKVRDELSTDNILKKISDYDIFKAYCPNFNEVGVKFIAELDRSKIEKLPSACISYYRGKLWYKDFGKPDKGMDCFSYIQKKYNLEFIYALNTINIDFNLGLQKVGLPSTTVNHFTSTGIKYSTKEYSTTIIQPKFRNWKGRDVKYWKEDYKILKPTLELYKVKPLQWYLLNDKFIQAERLTYSYNILKEFGVQYYKIYSPESKSFKWITNCKSTHYQGYPQLPESGDLLVITKSLKDVMELYQLGYNSIAPSNEAVSISYDKMLEFHKRFNKVILFYDNDLPGIEGSSKLAQYHGIDRIMIPFEYNAKDISDCVKLHGIDKGKEIMNKLLYE